MENDSDVNIEDMIWLLLDVIYDMKKVSLDYEEEFEVLVELDEELKLSYII